MKKFLLLVIVLGLISIVSFGDGLNASLNSFNLNLTPQSSSGTQTSLNSSQFTTVNASNLNSGVITASNRLKEVPSILGVEVVTAGSDFGFLAKGAGYYGNYTNRDALLIQKKLAYSIAYIQAKANLAKFLRGMSVKGKKQLVSSMDMIIKSNKTLVNTMQNYSDSFEGFGQALIKGTVVYYVYDNVNAHKVSVEIVVTSKTIAAANSIGPAVIESDSLRDGLNYVIHQINSYIVPPIGAKIVQVPQTGEIAVVSFGSAITSSSKDQQKRDLENQMLHQMAKGFADGAMVSFLKGDDFIWKTGCSESSNYNNDDFAKYYDKEGNLQVMPKIKKQFMTELQQTSNYKSIVRGQLPAGVQSKLYTDGNWWYVIDVYIPSISATAQQIYQEMQQSSTLQQPSRQKTSPATNYQGPSGFVSNLNGL